MLSSQQVAAERKETKVVMDNVIGDGSGERATGTANTIYDGSETRIVSGPTRPKDSWPSAHPPPARRELPRQRWERRRAPPPPWREER